MQSENVWSVAKLLRATREHLEETWSSSVIFCKESAEGDIVKSPQDG
jgi:hypothetical protein